MLMLVPTLAAHAAPHQEMCMMEELRARKDFLKWHMLGSSASSSGCPLSRRHCQEYVDTVSRLFQECDKDNSGSSTAG